MHALPLALLVLAAPAAAQPVVYVRAGATGAGDGTSWADAYPDLQPALQAAVPPAELWVAAGTYKPTSGADREATFRLRSGLALYGGFGGTEATRQERDPAANVTTLSGEIGSPTSILDNSYHVVTGSGTDSTAVLDGFAVTAAYARVCAFRFGGGMLIEGGTPTVRNARFHGSLAVGGGGVYNHNGGNGTFTDCLVEGNTSVSGGGGMGNEGSSPRLERVAFRDNTGTSGGGMLNWRGANPVCVDCTFEGNRAAEGGAVYNQGSAPLFLRARFLGNSTGSAGGGALRNEEVGGGGPTCSAWGASSGGTAPTTGPAARCTSAAARPCSSTPCSRTTGRSGGGAAPWRRTSAARRCSSTRRSPGTGPCAAAPSSC